MLKSKEKTMTLMNELRSTLKTWNTLGWNLCFSLPNRKAWTLQWSRWCLANLLSKVADLLNCRCRPPNEVTNICDRQHMSSRVRMFKPDTTAGFFRNIDFLLLWKYTKYKLKLHWIISSKNNKSQWLDTTPRKRSRFCTIKSRCTNISAMVSVDLQPTISVRSRDKHRMLIRRK